MLARNDSRERQLQDADASGHQNDEKGDGAKAYFETDDAV